MPGPNFITSIVNNARVDIEEASVYDTFIEATEQQSTQKKGEIIRVNDAVDFDVQLTGKTIYLEFLGTFNEDKADYQIFNGGAVGGSNTEYQTPITETTTVFDGTQKGENKIYVFEKDTAQTLQINEDDYVKDDLIAFERRGSGTLEFLQGAGVRFRGVRDIDNRFFVKEPNSMVFLKCRGDNEFSIIGNLKRGYTGAVIVTDSGPIYTGATAEDITLTGTGFSENMLVTTNGNATQTSAFTYVSSTEINLHITETGDVDDDIVITFDNGDISTHTITIEDTPASFVFESYAFEYGYALFKLKSTQTYGIRVRRSSDDAETDVGFDGFEKVSLNSPVSAGGDLTTWADTDDVFIVKKYNQGNGGTGFDLVQADSTKQAKLLSSGALIVQGSRVFNEFDGTNDIYETASTDDWLDNDLTVFADVRSKTSSIGTIVGNFSTTASERMGYLRYESTNILTGAICSEAGSATVANGGSAPVNTNHDIVLVSNDTNIKIITNGVSGTFATAPATRPSESRSIQYGNLTSYPTLCLDGYNNYLIMYKSDQEANISEIEDLITPFI